MGSMAVAPAVSAQDPVELEMWSWNNEGHYPKVHEDAIVRFEAANPGVTVKRGKSLCGDACGAQYFSYTDYLTKFKTSVAASEPPCIAQTPWSGEFLDYVNSGALIPLTDAIKTGFPAFFDPIVSIVSSNGDVWAIPLDVNTLQIAYNKTKFDELAITVPQTQSELQAAVDKLSEAGPLRGLDRHQGQVVRAVTCSSPRWPIRTAPTRSSWRLTRVRSAGTTRRSAAAADNVAAMVASGIFAPGANASDAFKGGQDLFVSQAAGMMYPVGNFVTGGHHGRGGRHLRVEPLPVPQAGRLHPGQPGHWRRRRDVQRDQGLPSSGAGHRVPAISGR